MFGQFVKSIGVDLGTANTLVYVKGEGIVINEPSVVAINKKTGNFVAIGREAKAMVGRTPAHITAIKPLVNGVISDFEVTEKMLHSFIQRAYGGEWQRFLARPQMLIGIPSEVTEVERGAVEDAARNAGAARVTLIDEPIAAAVGAELSIQEPTGHMVIDIGGGTAEIAVLSLGGIVVRKSLRIAGDKFDQDIIQYIRQNFNLLIGERTAEEIKIKIGSAVELPETLVTSVRGRDLLTGLPKEIMVSDEHVRDALRPSLFALVEAVKDVIETTPPELLTDIMDSAIILSGGGSLLKGLDALLYQATKVSVRPVEDPLTNVVRGIGLVLERPQDYTQLMLNASAPGQMTPKKYETP